MAITSRLASVGALCLLSAFAIPAMAQTAGMMSFQALLRDANGTPVDGPVTMSLTVVDAGGAVVAGPFAVSTSASAGVVSVKYGPVAPAVFNGAARFLRANVTSPALGLLTDVEIVTPPAIAEQVNVPGTGESALTVSPTGDVGVGTASPSDKFHVSGGDFRVVGTAGSAARFFLTPQSATHHRWRISAQQNANTGLEFGASTAPGNETYETRMTLLANGRVGIGTTTPGTSLDVRAVSTQDDQLKLQNFAHHGMYLYAGVSSYGTIRLGSGAPNPEANHLVLQDFGGNVGIGLVANPQQKLHVNGNTAIVGDLAIGAITPLSRLFVQQSSDTSNSGLQIANSAVNRSLHLWTDASSRGRIDCGLAGDSPICFNGAGAGNIGIGTSNPQFALHVRRNGPAAVSVENAQASRATALIAGTSANAVEFSGNLHFQAAAYASVGQGNGTTRVVITSGGGVGIGTNAPASPLDVAGNSNASAQAGTMRITRADTPNKYLYMGYDASDYAYIQAIHVGTAFKPLILNPLSGNVGIGTTSATSKLTVAGDIVSQVGSAFTQLGSGIEISAPTPFIDFHFAEAPDDFSARLICVGADQLQLDGARFGIGRVPASRALEVEGNASKTTAGEWLANSDRRIKQDITPIADALATLTRVRPASFRYTDDYRVAHPSIEDRRYVNVIAQEFAEVFPDHVKSSGEKLADGSEILQVDAWPLTIYAVAAIQEMHREMNARSNEIENLRSENMELKKRLERLETAILTQSGKENTR